MTPPSSIHRIKELLAKATMIENRYCEKCGRLMVHVTKIESYDKTNGKPEYRIYYRCPQKRLFNGHYEMNRYAWRGEVE